MKIFETKSKSGKVFYMPLDDDNKVIMPVYKYLENLAICGKSKNTLRKYCYHLLEFWKYLADNEFDYIEFAGGKSSTCKGFYDNLVDYRIHLLYPALKGKVTPIGGVERAREESTVNQMLSVVISFYQFLSDADIVGELHVIRQMGTMHHTHNMLNQMFLKKMETIKKSIVSSKVQEKKLRYVDEGEFNKCWDSCTSRRNRVIIGLMYYGGLRVSEVVGLNIEDLRDISENIVHIELRNDPDNKDAAVKNCSTGSVLITDKLRDEIVCYITEDLAYVDTNYLLINFKGSTAGGAMKTDTVREMVEALGKKVGIDCLHPHAFRHGCAMRMLRAGIDIAAISKFLRHKHIQTTADIYAKYDLSDKIRVQTELSEKLGESFAPLDIDFEKILEELFEGEEDDEDE